MSHDLRNLEASLSPKFDLSFASMGKPAEPYELPHDTRGEGLVSRKEENRKCQLFVSVFCTVNSWEYNLDKPAAFSDD